MSNCIVLGILNVIMQSHDSEMPGCRGRLEVPTAGRFSASIRLCKIWAWIDSLRSVFCGDGCSFRIGHITNWRAPKPCKLEARSPPATLSAAESVFSTTFWRCWLLLRNPIFLLYDCSPLLPSSRLLLASFFPFSFLYDSLEE